MSHMIPAGPQSKSPTSIFLNESEKKGLVFQRWLYIVCENLHFSFLFVRGHMICCVCRLDIVVGETWARAHGHEQFSWASTRAVSARRCVQVLSGSQSLLNLVVS